MEQDKEVNGDGFVVGNGWGVVRRCHERKSVIGGGLRVDEGEGTGSFM